MARCQAPGHVLHGRGKRGYGEAAPGDHLQTGYKLWLVGHQLEHGRAPWRDPYSFQPEVKPRWNLAGWPFGDVYWPLQRAFGTVLAWNVFVLLGFLGAGGLAALWLRELSAAARRGARGRARVRAGAVPAGAVERGAPARVDRDAPAAVALRARAGEKGLGLVARPLGRRSRIDSRSRASSTSRSARIPFFAALRARPRPVGGAARRACAGGGCAWRIGSSCEGRPVRAAAPSPRSSTTRPTCPTFSRANQHELEGIVYLGWTVLPLAVAGLAVLLIARRWGLALVLGLGALVPTLLALGANLPGYETLWRHLPGSAAHSRARALDADRVPGAGCARRRRRLTSELAGHRRNRRCALAARSPSRPLPRDRGRRAQPRLRRAALTALRDGCSSFRCSSRTTRTRASTSTTSCRRTRPHPSGYSTTAPLAADTTLRELQGAPCRNLATFGVRYLATHFGRSNPCGGRLVARDGPIATYSVGP